MSISLADLPFACPMSRTVLSVAHRLGFDVQGVKMGK